VLDSIFSFYNLDKPTVIYINVSKEWSVERLMKRGRADDKREEIIERLSWFETEVLPTIEYYRNSKSYSFVEINGEQDIDSVRREIISKIK
jgi:adenylate kinase family enzyme